MLDIPGLLTAIIALAAVMGLIVLIGRVARIGGMGPKSGQHLAVREVIALDSRRRLHLVRCGGRDVVLLTGGGQDVVVGWLPSPEPPP